MALHPGDHHTTARAVIAFLVVVIALGVLMLFYNNQDVLVYSEAFHPFVFLSVAAFVLLLVLMYFANKPHHHKSSGKKKRR